MTNKFTPGPWKADEVMEGGERTFDIFIKDETIAKVLVWDDPEGVKRARANATMIAETPTLLQAAEDLANAIDYNFENPELITLQDSIVFIKRLKVLRESIARARGK